MVSATAYASIIVLASTPRAPIAAQPLAYTFRTTRPSAPTTRPRTVERWPSAGSYHGADGSERCPREVMTRSVSSVDDSPVGTAREDRSSAVWASVSRALSFSCGGAGVVRPVGERKKSSDHVFLVVPGLFFEPFCSSCRVRDCWRVTVVVFVASARSAGSSGTMDESGRFIISRSSFVVKAACSGPRRPTMETCSTAERRRTSRTGVGTSYLARWSGGVRSMRATSSETLPCPMRVTCLVRSSGGVGGFEGCWVYQ